MRGEIFTEDDIHLLHLALGAKCILVAAWEQAFLPPQLQLHGGVIRQVLCVCMSGLQAANLIPSSPLSFPASSQQGVVSVKCKVALKMPNIVNSRIHFCPPAAPALSL